MRVRVEMGVVEDGVGPQSAPPAFPEPIAKGIRFVARARSQNTAKNQHRQITVRNVVALIEVNFSRLLHEDFLSSNAFMPCLISASARLGPPTFVTLNFFPCN